MPDQIVIEGNLVRTVRTEIINETRLEDLLPRIEFRPPVFLGPLPKNVKFVNWDESGETKRVLILAEMTPGQRNLRYNTRRYNVSIPWTYFLFEYTTTAPDANAHGVWSPSNTRVFWAREEVTSLDSMVGRALTANCSMDGSICFGSTGVPAHLPLGTRIERTMHEFYLTQFAHDSGTGSPWGSETGSVSWARWHRESDGDPQAWRRMPEWNLNAPEAHPAIGPFQTVRQLMTMREVRPIAVEVQGHIPDMILPFTFGRAEEWLRSPDFGHTPEERAANRFRLLTALNNITTEEPEFAQAPIEPVVNDEDLGGVPIGPDEDA